MKNLTINDQALYRLYAVGMLTYEEALKQADSEVYLRRAMLEFDQLAKGPAPANPLNASTPPAAGSRRANT
jgi:Tfp pilus assembly ATPase PilU